MKSGRLAWLSTAVFLDVNGIDPAGIPDDDVHDSVMELAGDHEVTEIAHP